jgi:hypothetical protein
VLQGKVLEREIVFESVAGFGGAWENCPSEPILLKKKVLGEERQTMSNR